MSRLRLSLQLMCSGGESCSLSSLGTVMPGMAKMSVGGVRERGLLRYWRRVLLSYVILVPAEVKKINNCKIELLNWFLKNWFYFLIFKSL